jgi:hypothetical protein
VGHMPMLERPAEVNDALVELLQRSTLRTRSIVRRWRKRA